MIIIVKTSMVARDSLDRTKIDIDRGAGSTRDLWKRPYRRRRRAACRRISKMRRRRRMVGMVVVNISLTLRRNRPENRGDAKVGDILDLDRTVLRMGSLCFWSDSTGRTASNGDGECLDKKIKAFSKLKFGIGRDTRRLILGGLLQRGLGGSRGRRRSRSSRVGSRGYSREMV